MKKVLFIIDTLETGGAEKSLFEITSRFRRYKPVFIQLFDGGTLKPLFESYQIEVIQAGFTPSYKFRKMANQLTQMVKDLGPELIHSTLFRSDMVARQLTRCTGLPLINSLVNNSYSRHRYVNLSPISKLKLFVIQQLDRYTVRHVDLFISNSRSIMESSISALGIKKEIVKVVYRGRDFKIFDDVDPDICDRLRYGLHLTGKKVFLNVGRLLDRKGQLDLINAFNLLRSRHDDVVLLIAGEGAYRSTLELRVKELGLGQSVKLLGNREDIPELLAMADYFVFPSHYEGLPGALIEAILASTPVIASDIPENRECLDEGNGLLFRKGDIQDLVVKMDEALKLNDWAQKNKLAKDHAMKKFEINTIAAEYEEIYDSLIDK